jgi:signal transduction histidine kinase
MTGNWQQIRPKRFSATGPKISEGTNDHFVTTDVDSMVGDAIFQVQMEAPAQAVTGFRLDVFPFKRPDRREWRVSWSDIRDICLTEFRVEANRATTTNIALGREVRASHPLWAGVSAKALTDGLPGSYAHPQDTALGLAFFFELDLGAVHRLDHLGLRNRSDGYAADRMSRIHLQIYDRTPDAGVAPVWTAITRADGSHPRSGMVDLVRAADGTGVFQGRYIRLSSDSPVALSPQFAEVEVYETLTPALVSIRADDVVIGADRSIAVPAGTQRLKAELAVMGEDGMEPAAIRWRLKGIADEWQTTGDHTVEVLRPPAGSYTFEAQVRHSDGEWNESTLSVPVVVAANFWEIASFWWFTGGGCVLVALTLAKETLRRRENRRLAEMRHQSALADERARIARDMHDEVGARLSQIALMQDLIIRKHELPEALRRGLSEVAATTRRAAHALDHVVWAVNPMRDTLAELAGYLSHEASSYLAPLNISCRLELPSRWPDVPVRAQVRNQLTLAFQEALQNIVKHARATGVTLVIDYSEPQLTIRLTDNGFGLPADTNGAGKDGIANMGTRLASIGGSCSVRGCDRGSGTEVEFCVSLNPAARI